jgi:hypothetical protein
LAVPLLAIAFVLVSHVVVVRDASRPAGGLVSPEPIVAWSWRDEAWSLRPTNYLHNKIVSLRAFRETFPVGLGPGRQPAYADALQQAGEQPRAILLGAPHSTVTGTAAELGVLGLAGLFALIVWGVRGIRALPERDPLRAPVLALACAAAVESLATDQMHFRHYVWVAAVVSARLAAEDRDQRGG